MLESFKFFDAYSLRARLFPAIIAGLPSLALIITLVPWDHVGLPHVIAGSVSTVLLFAFSDIARRAGKAAEDKLGTRATPELWHHDNPVIDPNSKQRYKEFIGRALDSPVPTDDEERLDRVKANQFYLSASNWLRENARDTKKFNLLFSENVTYGFRRNLYGLKYLALALNVLVIMLSASILAEYIPGFADIAGITKKLQVVIAAAVLHSLYMVFAVDANGVREASRTYGRQLILSCVVLMKESVTPNPRPARTKKKPE